MGLLHPHCNDSKYNTGLPGLLWIYYFSFSFLHSPPLKNFIFSSVDPGLVNIVSGEAEPGPALWKALTASLGSAPGPGPSHRRQSWGHNESEGPARIPGSEKQRRLVTFLSYLHCRSLWIVSRLLSSSIWHKNKLIIPEAPRLGSPPAGQRLRDSAWVYCGWFTACQAGSEKLLLLSCVPSHAHLPPPMVTSFQVSTNRTLNSGFSPRFL